MPSTRREFLAAAAAATALSSRASAAPAAPASSWVDKPLRWAQLTLVEDDPGKYDLNFWLDYFRRTHSDAACLSAGGCVAFYPTKIPLHYKTPWMKDTDPFGDLVAGCRKLNMAVVARTDPTPSIRTFTTLTPIGSPSKPMASRAVTGPRPISGSPVPSAPTTSIS